MTDLALDLEHLGKDAKRWPEFGSSVADLGGWGNTLICTISEEVDLIADFLRAYNSFCGSFTARGNEVESAMKAIGTTLTSVVNSFKNVDNPR